jgi:hypothetical protein
MENWEKQLSCAEHCIRCNKSLTAKDRRFLSVVDYEDASRQMMAECMEQTGKPYGDPAGYCFHHFCPFKCD